HMRSIEPFVLLPSLIPGQLLRKLVDVDTPPRRTWYACFDLFRHGHVTAANIKTANDRGLGQVTLDHLRKQTRQAPDSRTMRHRLVGPDQPAPERPFLLQGDRRAH